MNGAHNMTAKLTRRDIGNLDQDDLDLIHSAYSLMDSMDRRTVPCDASKRLIKRVAKIAELLEQLSTDLDEVPR
jgi:hypothetical protein